MYKLEMKKKTGKYFWLHLVQLSSYIHLTNTIYVETITNSVLTQICCVLTRRYSFENFSSHEFLKSLCIKSRMMNWYCILKDKKTVVFYVS